MVVLLLPGAEWEPFCKDSILMDAILYSCSRQNVRVWWEEDVVLFSPPRRGCGAIFYAVTQREVKVEDSEKPVFETVYPDIDESCMLWPIRCLAESGIRKNYPERCV